MSILTCQCEVCIPDRRGIDCIECGHIIATEMKRIFCMCREYKLSKQVLCGECYGYRFSGDDRKKTCLEIDQYWRSKKKLEAHRVSEIRTVAKTRSMTRLCKTTR